MRISDAQAERISPIREADEPFTVLIPPSLRRKLDAVASVRGTKTGPSVRWIFERWLEAPRGLSTAERARLNEILDAPEREEVPA